MPENPLLLESHIHAILRERPIANAIFQLMGVRPGGSFLVYAPNTGRYHVGEISVEDTLEQARVASIEQNPMKAWQPFANNEYMKVLRAYHSPDNIPINTRSGYLLVFHISERSPEDFLDTQTLQNLRCHAGYQTSNQHLMLSCYQALLLNQMKKTNLNSAMVYFESRDDNNPNLANMVMVEQAGGPLSLEQLRLYHALDMAATLKSRNSDSQVLIYRKSQVVLNLQDGSTF